MFGKLNLVAAALALAVVAGGQAFAGGVQDQSVQTKVSTPSKQVGKGVNIQQQVSMPKGKTQQIGTQGGKGQVQVGTQGGKGQVQVGTQGFKGQTQVGIQGGKSQFQAGRQMKGKRQGLTITE